jgi:hypothetical protein
MYDANVLHSSKRYDMPTYSQIKSDLEGLSRLQQYVLLLQTNEWYDFRRHIIYRDNDCCRKCGRRGGPIEEEIPYDHGKRKHSSVVVEHNEAFLKFAKENPDEITNQLLNGTYEGQWPERARTKIIGEVILQAHHKLYFWDSLPWEYDKKHLSTLCQDCHREEHLRNTIYTFNDKSMKLRKAWPRCLKCEGTGYIPMYDHRDNGICYECGGWGLLISDTPSWEEV